MTYGRDKVGYGDCVPTDEDNKKHQRDMEDLEKIINIRDKPKNHRTDEERSILRRYYGL